MGIKDLISKIISDELEVQSSFEVLRNKTIGVDVSNYMFKLVTSRNILVRDFMLILVSIFQLTSPNSGTPLRSCATDSLSNSY